MFSGPRRRVLKVLILGLLALPFNLTASVPAHAYQSPTFDGIGEISGSEFTWITLKGVNLSHDGSRPEGYQGVYYYETDAQNIVIGSAVPIPAGHIRNNPSGDGSIQVIAPVGVPYLTFQIDACDDWVYQFQCRSLFTQDFFHVDSVLTQTFSGLAVTQGRGYQWVTLLGEHLSHNDSSTAGWQGVFYRPVGTASWIPLLSGNIRNYPDNLTNDSSTIQVRIPETQGSFEFHVDACDIWDVSIGITGCISFEPSDTYSIVNPSTFTGISPSAGSSNQWITLQGENLAHSSSNSPGYQTVYYGAAGNWTAITDTSTIRDNPANDGSIQVQAPAGVSSFQFHLDVCTNWEVGQDLSRGEYCYGLDNAATFTNSAGVLGIHPNNGDSDTVLSVTYGNTYQLPPAPTKDHFVFKEWNTDPAGIGTSYAPATEVVINADTDIYAQWIPDTSPLIKLYMDAPFVQGSYATGSKVRKDNFNALTRSGVGACNGETFNVGVVSSGVCSLFNSDAFGAASDSSEQVAGGGGSVMVSNYQPSGPQSYTITFPNIKKYVGFWWAAGSAGNSVSFLSGGVPVATLSVNQLNSIFGSAPATDAEYAAATTTIMAINGSSYPKKYYFGNPNGYTTTTPDVRSTSADTTKYTPYVYIHAFADNGAYFDGIEISGYGFELDNLAVGQATITVDPRLIYVQGIEADSSALNASERIYFATYHDDLSTSGAVPTDSSSPYALGDAVTVLSNSGSLARTGYRLTGWSTGPNGSGVILHVGDTTTIADDIDFFPIWQQVHTVTYDGNSHTAGSVPVDTSSPFSIGESVTVKSNSGSLLRDGYTFEGWNTRSNGTGTTYQPGDTFTISSSLILYALWQQVPTPPQQQQQQQQQQQYPPSQNPPSQDSVPSTPIQSPTPTPTPAPTPTPTPTPSTPAAQPQPSPAPISAQSPTPRPTPMPTKSSAPKPTPLPTSKQITLDQVKGSVKPEIDTSTGVVTLSLSSFPVRTGSTSQLIAVATDQSSGKKEKVSFPAKSKGTEVQLTGLAPDSTYKIELIYISTKGQLKTLQSFVIKTPDLEPSISLKTNSVSGSTSVDINASHKEKVRIYIGKSAPITKPQPIVTKSPAPTPTSTPKVRIFIGKAEK